LSARIADLFHGSAIGTQLVGDEHFRLAMALHGFPQEFQSRFAVTALGHKAFKHLALVVHGPSKRVRLTVDLQENLVEVQLPMCPWPHPVHPSAADLSREHQTEPVPPKPYRLMADVDAAFMQKIFHIPQRERKPHIHHNSQADDLGARLKITKGGTFCHPATLSTRPARLKQVSSDSAVARIWGIDLPQPSLTPRQITIIPTLKRRAGDTELCQHLSCRQMALFNQPDDLKHLKCRPKLSRPRDERSARPLAFHQELSP
jgi:hypothetical protein